VSQGLPAFGASANGQHTLPRLHERVDFTKATGEFDRTQALFRPTANSFVALKAAVEGQYTENILPPEEKFYLGGPHFDRGFYYGEVTGDKGLAATIEPQFDIKLFDVASSGGFLQNEPALRSRYISPTIRAQFYAFFDWGETWENQALDLGHTLRSIGGGVRLYNAEQYGEQKVELDLEGVSRLTRTPDGGAVSRLKSSAFYWQILVSY
jgi:hemolysin activation/secretion protein